mgnify:FL=1
MQVRDQVGYRSPISRSKVVKKVGTEDDNVIVFGGHRCDLGPELSDT